MLRAVEACKEGMSVRLAVRLYKVPRSTLADRVNGRVTHGAVSGPGQLLSKSDELSLVRYCQHGKPWAPSHKKPMFRLWHLHQPLDVGFFAPLKAEFAKAASNLCQIRHSFVVAKGNFARVLSGPYERCKARSRIRIACHPPSTSSVPPPPVPPRPRIHPLVASGDISVDLAEILMECDYKKNQRVASLWLRGLLQERSSSGSSGNGKKRSRRQLPLKSSGPSCEGVKWSSWPRGSCQLLYCGRI
ncbi:hypothetical protein SKAU_G00206860 [Synaphobranchus kaupii]|uniref:HTH psq-type domain-containing protein n=1 Tax=Synaphobranchus kaupii TaxID=118154 RepID=A0A9Q1IU67_SYNKA|nr:hypothetical protein SKAU_G00206860 [Synaphobranchus kaupii]